MTDGARVEPMQTLAVGLWHFRLEWYEVYGLRQHLRGSSTACLARARDASLRMTELWGDGGRMVAGCGGQDDGRVGGVIVLPVSCAGSLWKAQNNRSRSAGGYNV